MKPVIYSTAAEADENSILRGYYNISPKLAERLYRLIKGALNLIHTHPKAWPSYFEDFRKVIVEPFPIAVVYQEKPEVIRVVAIVDLRREPGYWRNRT